MYRIAPQIADFAAFCFLNEPHCGACFFTIFLRFFLRVFFVKKLVKIQAFFLPLKKSFFFETTLDFSKK